MDTLMRCGRSLAHRGMVNLPTLHSRLALQLPLPVLCFTFTRRFTVLLVCLLIRMLVHSIVFVTLWVRLPVLELVTPLHLQLRVSLIFRLGRSRIDKTFTVIQLRQCLRVSIWLVLLDTKLLRLTVLALITSCSLQTLVMRFAISFSLFVTRLVRVLTLFRAFFV